MRSFLKQGRLIPGSLVALTFFLMMGKEVGCGSSSGSGDDSGEPVEVTGAPAETPISIDDTEGTDPTFFEFEDSEASDSGSDTAVVGTILGQTFNYPVSVGVVIDGVIVKTLIASPTFRFDVQRQWIGKPILFQVLTNRGLAKPTSSGSYPVIVTVGSQNSTVFGTRRPISVQVSNNNESSSDLAASLQNHGIAFDSSGRFLSDSTDADGNSQLVTGSLSGALSVLSDTSESFTRFVYDSTDQIYAFAADNLDLFRLSADGSELTNIDTTVRPFFSGFTFPATLTRSFSLSPSSTRIVWSVKMTETQKTTETQKPTVSDVALTTPFFIQFSGDTLSSNLLNVDWIDDTRFFALQGFSDKTSVLRVVDISSVLSTATAGSTQTLTVTPLLSTAIALSAVKADRVNQNQAVLRCEESSVGNGLCLVNTSDGNMTTIVAGSYHVTNMFGFTVNSDNIYFCADINGDDSSSIDDLTNLVDNVIGIYNLTSETTTFLDYGVNPAPSSTDANIIGYQRVDETGALQLAVANLDNFSL